jgi:hypothetical protein
MTDTGANVTLALIEDMEIESVSQQQLMLNLLFEPFQIEKSKNRSNQF